MSTFNSFPRCCNITLDLATGIIPSGGGPTPPVPLNTFWTQVAIGGGLDILEAPDYGTGFILDNASLAGFLQGSYYPESGSTLEDSLSFYTFWIATDKSEAPVDWTWNTDPIEFFPLETDAVSRCFHTAVYAMPGSVGTDSAWLHGFLFDLGFPDAASNITTVYDDAGFETAIGVYVTNLFGLNATFSAVVTDTDAQLVINNTYLPLLRVSTDNGVDPVQQNPFTDYTCP